MSTTLTITRPQRLGWLAGGALVSVLGALLIAPAMNPVRAQDTDDATRAHAERHRHRHRDRRARYRGHHRRRDRDAGPGRRRRRRMPRTSWMPSSRPSRHWASRTRTSRPRPCSSTRVYDYSGNTPSLTGYQATNLVTVTVRDITKTGAVVDAATGAGATDVSSISFRLDDQVAAEAAAREKAVLTRASQGRDHRHRGRCRDHGRHLHQRDQRPRADARVLRSGRGHGRRRAGTHSGPGRHHRPDGHRRDRVQHPLTGDHTSQPGAAVRRAAALPCPASDRAARCPAPGRPHRASGTSAGRGTAGPRPGRRPPAVGPTRIGGDPRSARASARCRASADSGRVVRRAS